MNFHWQHAEDDYDISECLSVAMAVEVDLQFLTDMRKPTCELRLAILGIQAGSSSPPGSVTLTFSTLAVLLNEKSANGHGILNFL